MHRRTRASAMILVLTLTLLMGVITYGIRLLSQASYREVDGLSRHLKALAIAEVVFGEVLTRLRATRWSQRWFQVPQIVEDRPVLDGTGSWLIQDAPDADHVAELLVRARYDDSTVVMFWRLRVVEDSLELFGRVFPQTFAFADPDTPLDPTRLGGIQGRVREILRRRQENEGELRRIRDEIGPGARAGDIARALGLATPDQVQDGKPPPPQDPPTLITVTPPMAPGGLSGPGETTPECQPATNLGAVRGVWRVLEPPIERIVRCIDPTFAMPGRPPYRDRALSVQTELGAVLEAPLISGLDDSLPLGAVDGIKPGAGSILRRGADEGCAIMTELRETLNLDPDTLCDP